MFKFIEIEDSAGNKRLININYITDVVDNKIYLASSDNMQQAYIDCKQGYEAIKGLLRVSLN